MVKFDGTPLKQHYGPKATRMALLRSLSSDIDRIHKWRLSNYSFVFMLIILTSLVNTRKIQKSFCSKVTLVRMINTKTKE